MSLEKQSLVLILALSIFLAYSAEARIAPSPEVMDAGEGGIAPSLEGLDDEGVGGLVPSLDGLEAGAGGIAPSSLEGVDAGEGAIAPSSLKGVDAGEGAIAPSSLEGVAAGEGGIALSPEGVIAGEGGIALSPEGVNAGEGGIAFDALKAIIPEGEQQLIQFKNRIDETPLSPHSEKCLRSCYALYDKEILDFKKFTDVLSGSTITDVDFDITIERAQLDTCDVCLRELGKKDPEFNKYAEWFYTTNQKVEELFNKFNS